MIDRKELQYVYNLTESYAQTALYFGISKQRVHQLITGYKTIYNSMNKSLQRELMLRGTTCEQCKESKFKNIHHLDGNSNNNAPINLIKVCKPCHNALHTGIEHKSKYRGKICAGFCGRILGAEVTLNGKICAACIIAKKEGRSEVNPYGKYRNLNKLCGICGVNQKGKHMRKGMCLTHYNLWRYFFDTKFQQNLKMSYQKKMYQRLNTI